MGRTYDEFSQPVIASRSCGFSSDFDKDDEELLHHQRQAVPAANRLLYQAASEVVNLRRLSTAS